MFVDQRPPSDKKLMSVRVDAKIIWTAIRDLWFM